MLTPFIVGFKFELHMSTGDLSNVTTVAVLKSSISDIGVSIRLPKDTTPWTDNDTHFTGMITL